MSTSKHSNSLAPTIEFKYNRKKQDKRLNNHHLPLHIPQQTKHNSGDPPLCSTQMVQYQLPIGFRDAYHRMGGGGRESTKFLGTINLHW